MRVTRSLVRISCFIFGPIVLASYWYTISKMEDPMALWGGIPEDLRSANTFCMFVAATGFLIMWWLFLYRWDSADVETRHLNRHRRGHRSIRWAIEQAFNAVSVI